MREVQEAVGGLNENSNDLSNLDLLLAASAIFRFTRVNRLLGLFRHYKHTIAQIK